MTGNGIGKSEPLMVGLVGTGYAAKLRAQALQMDVRARLIAVAGHTPATTQAFSELYGAAAIAHWVDLVHQPSLDLVVVANPNRDHGAIVLAALNAGKHVIVEYPLALDVAEAEAAVALAQSNGKLLHVEHIELLGGVHQAAKASLAAVGIPFYARYATVKPERPAPQRWTYHPELFGFPLMGAISRVHRLVDLFGAVDTVSSQLQVQPREHDPHYMTCFCTAQLRFQSGLLADVVYAKGEALWQSERTLAIHGELGAIVFEGDQGVLMQAQGNQPIAVGSRRGVFARDTAMVLDYLYQGTPLYVSPAQSLYTLKVADAARRSAETGHCIHVASAA